MSKKQAEWLQAADMQLSGRRAAACSAAKQRTEADHRGGHVSHYHGGSLGEFPASRPSHSGALVVGRSEKVHTTTSTTTNSSTGVVKKTTITTKTITYADGSVRTETEERTEEIPPHVDRSPDVRGAQLRFADLRLGTGSAVTKPGSGSLRTEAPKADASQHFARSALRAHNVYRSMHGAGPLVLAPDLSNYAQQWANEIAKKGSMHHSNCTLNGSRIGENIAAKWSSNGEDLAGDDATSQWYSEERKYNYKAAKFESGTGHFTQVVWKSSKELGIGKAVAANGFVFVVASYRPAGNVMGAFTANVGPKQ